MPTRHNKERLFEVMGKVNPDFILNEQNPQPPERDPSWIDDNTLSVGELKQAIYIYSHSKSKEEAIETAKKSGVDILKCVVGLIGAAGFVAGTIGTGGALVAVAGGVAMGAAGSAATTHDIYNVFKKFMGPKKKSDPKTPSGFMQLLRIDPEVSILLDDRIENEFIDFAVKKLNTMQNTEPVPNFFNELRQFIKEKYAQIYNISYSTQQPTQ